MSPTDACNQKKVITVNVLASVGFSWMSWMPHHDCLRQSGLDKLVTPNPDW